MVKNLLDQALLCIDDRRSHRKFKKLREAFKKKQAEKLKSREIKDVEGCRRMMKDDEG